MNLKIELLERRDLLTVLRLASWNTANRPDNLVEDAEYQTVLEAIGAESVQGNATRIDLLALQETDPPGSGQNSIGRIESILEGLYAGTDYSTAITNIDGGGDATGFVYDTDTLSLLELEELTVGLTHNTIRGKFRPTGTIGTADFYVYSTHLKSGTGAVFESQRGSEANLLRMDVDSLGTSAQVIMAGDFNIRSSSEPAYVNFLAAGTGQFADPINSPGNWHDNNAFRSVHTQNPTDPTSGGGGMDDRFDFQLATNELFDGLGIDYVANSYHAFGNNGTHSLNGSITSGSGADAAVLAALAGASDHLPVVADYQVLESTPGIVITESSGSTTVIEGGNLDTYTISLNSAPLSPITITVTPDLQTDVGAGPGSSISLVFTPETAFTGQTVIVNANDDVNSEGTHISTIVHASMSSDLDYDALPISDVVATVLDNESPTIVINEIDSDTAGIDMLEFVELYDGGVGNSSLSGKSIVLYNGSSDTSYAVFDLDGFSTNDNGFFLLGNSATNPQISFANNSLQNGADAVALYAADATDFPNGTSVTVADLLDAVVYDTNDADDLGLLGLLLPSEPQVNEQANNSQPVDSIARVPDFGSPRMTANYVAQAPTPGNYNAISATGIIITESGGRTDIAEGSMTDSYTISLVSFPTDDVIVTIAPDDQVDLGNGPGIAIQRTFTSSNGLVPQTIIVAAVDDSLIEGPHSALITHSSVSDDPDFDGISIANVTASVTDNEPPPLINVVMTEIMYNPASDETSPGVGEWIELVNKSNVAVDLNGWTFDDEDGTDWGAFPAQTALDIDQVAVFFDIDFTSESQFRSSWAVPASALVIGIDWGNLANGPSATNEILRLLDNSSQVHDEVNYDDSGDWPSDNPDGPSIYLTGINLDNNVGLSWASSTVGVDSARNPTAPFDGSDVGSPGFAPSSSIDGDFDDDGDFDCDDIDALVAEIAFASSDLSFDLTGDGSLNLADVDAWLLEAGEVNLGAGRPYLAGDANLDGAVDGGDFLVWNDHKFTSTVAWCSGDFNASGAVDGGDFLIWNDHKFQSSDNGPVSQSLDSTLRDDAKQTVNTLQTSAFHERRLQAPPRHHLVHRPQEMNRRFAQSKGRDDGQQTHLMFRDLDHQDDRLSDSLPSSFSHHFHVASALSTAKSVSSIE